MLKRSILFFLTLLMSMAGTSAAAMSVHADGVAKDYHDARVTKLVNQLAKDSNHSRVLKRTGNSIKLAPADSSIQQSDIRQLKNEIKADGANNMEADKAVSTIIGLAQDDSFTIPTTNKGIVSVGGKSGIKMLLPGSNNSSAEVNANDTVTYPNSDIHSDTVLTANGMQDIETYHVIRAADAPTQYVYTFQNLPRGAYFYQVDRHTIKVELDVFNPKINISTTRDIATISAPWAKDALDRPVDVYLTTTGNQVTMNVNHTRTLGGQTAVYPVVADPGVNFYWWGYEIWADNWTLTHFSALSGLVAARFGWSVAGASAAVITFAMQWCQGRNGASFYFTWFSGVPLWGSFAGCRGW